MQDDAFYKTIVFEAFADFPRYWKRNTGYCERV